MLQSQAHEINSQKDMLLMEHIDTNYLISLNGQRPSNKTELQNFRARQKLFIDVCNQKQVKHLPYSLDKQNVEIQGEL